MGYEPNELPLLHPASIPGVIKTNEVRTPDSVQTVICLRSGLAPIWLRLACRVLPGLAVAAAMRPNVMPGPLTLLPVVRSPSRPRYRAPLVGSYPTVSPLTRIPTWETAGGTALCCGCSHTLSSFRDPKRTEACPHLLFREATLPIQAGRLGVGKFLCPITLDSDGSPRLIDTPVS